MKRVLFVILAMCFVGSGMVFSQAKEPNLAYPEEIAGWSEAVKASQRAAGEALIPKIMQAIASKLPQFIIEPGHYRFSPAFLRQPVMIEHAADFKIVANDVTFWMEKPDGSLLSITNSKNITITGLTIDYDPLPFTQGTIVGLHPEDKAILVEIDNGFPSPSDSHIGPAIEAGKKARINIYTPDGVLRENVRDDWVSGFEGLADGVWKMIMQGGWNFQQPIVTMNPYRLGDKVVIPVRAGSLFRVSDSESVVFDQCNVYSSGGMAFSSVYGKGKHVYNKVNIIPRPATERLLSAVADGIHSYNSETGPIVNECRIENLGDDAVAIHGFFGIAFKNQQVSNMIEVINPMVYNYREGMDLEFYGFWNMDEYGSAIIEGVEVLSGNEASTRIENLRSDYQSRGNRLRTFPNQTIYRITLNRPVILPDDALVVNNDLVSAGFRVTNNRIRNILPRGILVKSANGIISGNDIAYVGQAGIALLSEADYWLEGPFNRDILIESNKIDHACISINSRMQPDAIGAIYVDVKKNTDFTGKYLVKDITIRNNQISNSGTPGISINSTQSLIVENNIITNPVMLKPVNNTNHYGIYIGCCEDLHVDGNQITSDHQWMISPLGFAMCAETGSLYPVHKDDFLLYPNPVQQSFTAEMTGQLFSLSVYDLKGAKVLEHPTAYHQVKIDSSRLAPGVTIENDVLSVSVSTLGAELQSIRHLSTGEEYLWQGDPAYWAARAPVMFPVNVRFKDDRFTYRGNTYEMPRLGLAVDAHFRVMDDSRPDRVVLELSSDNKTLKHYPFPFRFELGLSLDGNRLVHRFVVENTGPDTMYFALGGHPGLRCPLAGGLTRGDYQLAFPENLDLERLEVDNSLILPSSKPFLQDERAFALDDPRVPGSGMFLQNLPVREIGIGRMGHDPYVSVDLGDFPNVNIWTPPGMPYVCIEPMVGHHDLLHSPEEIDKKSFLTALPPGRKNQYSFSIIVHGGIGGHDNK